MNMKATGIIRRLDDLGRVVITKDLRKLCGLEEGDPVEFFIDNDHNIIIKKYNPEEV